MLAFAPIVLVCALGAAVSATRPSLLQLGILLSVALVVLAVTLHAPQAVLVGLCFWLTFLGLVRRVFIGSGSAALLGDPLLLVGPLTIVLLFFCAAGRGALRNRTPLANSVAALSLLALAEAANPLQGGLTVGLGGLLLIEIPLLAFWVGRALLTHETLRRILRLIASLGILASGYGLFQTYVGFPSWDTAWIHEKLSTQSYIALQVQGVIRAFASFSSAQEYVAFLSLAFVVWLALLSGRARRVAAIFPLGLLGLAIFLESGRGAVVVVAVALGVMIAARMAVRPTGALIAAVAAIALLSVTVNTFRNPRTVQTRAGSPTNALVSHQLSGLSDPFNSKTSSLAGHFQLVVHGLKQGFTQPLGHGTGSITIAASKFGGINTGTEDDPSNAGVAFGALGIVLYLLILGRGLKRTFDLARSRKDAMSLAVFGVLVVTILQWLNGSLYAVTWLVWLCLGWVDQQEPVSAPGGEKAVGSATGGGEIRQGIG